ncbi:ATP-binding protein [Marivita sp.]|uniref:sensor histidine kinase n=1 Tax=Marivita sp. TaxID=2003365 RepID=UPI003A874300
MSDLPHFPRGKPLSKCQRRAEKEQRLLQASSVRAQLISLWAGVLLIWSASALWAEAPVLLLNPNYAPYDAVPFTAYVIGDYAPRDIEYTGTSLNDVLSLDREGKFEPVTSQEIGFGRIWNLVHLKTRVKNPTDTAQTWMLASNTTYRNLMTVHLIVDGAPQPTDPIYQNLKYSEWHGIDVHPHVAFSLPAQSTATIYVSYSNGSSSFPMTFETEDGYDNRRRFETITAFVKLALASGFASVAVVFMVAIRHVATIPYTIYVSSVVVSLLDLGGHLYLFFPYPLIADTIIIESIFFNLMLVGILFFQRAYLMGENAVPRYCTFLAIASVLPIIFALGDLLLPQPIPGNITYPVTALLFTLSPVSGVLAYVYKLRGSVLFLLGNTVLTASIYWLLVAAFLSDTHLLTFAHSLTRYALMFEVFMFSLALFYQVRGMRIDTENSLRAEIRATKEKLAMAEALSAAAHDMQQPLTSLRLTMRDMKGKASADIDAAFDYLDELLRRNITEHQPADSAQSVDSLVSHAALPPIISDEPFEVGTVLNHAYSMFQEEAAGKGVKLVMVPSTLQSRGTVFAVMRIVTNLLSNAIKNTSSGKIVMGARSADQWVRIEIHDSGTGIQKAQLKDIMQPFQRAGEYPGSGLGLSIVQQLTEENGFHFELVSEAGRGTIARVCIPKADR